MDENYVFIRIVGKGGMERGTVIEDAIPFDKIANTLNREDLVMSMVNRMMTELQEYENNYPDEIKKELGI